ncbi:MAG TPA: hypothetical protein VK750_09520 [Cytophagaceae bacterium]|jgi:hypothetical protein|nr:hypothetical protein [Cytophagaceae bacterium]
MKSLVCIIFVSCIFCIVSCKKSNSSDPAPSAPIQYTNKGNGMVFYSGHDTLDVTAKDTSFFSLRGTSIAKQTDNLVVQIIFPGGRPKAGYYTQAKDNVTVSILASPQPHTIGSTQYWSMNRTDTIMVTVSGNTLKASFTNAAFGAQVGSSPTITTNYYTGNLTSN